MDRNARGAEEAYYAQLGMLHHRSLSETDIDAPTVQKVIHGRRRRGQYFSQELFGEPAWDILLEVLYAELIHVTITLARLSRRTGIAQTTVIRWLRILADHGLIFRRNDPFDSRQIFIELTPAARQAMHQFFKNEAG